MALTKGHIRIPDMLFSEREEMLIMFSDEQLRQHIRELQQFLFGISHYNVRIPVIIPDGIYGPETAGAVKIFQQEYGLMPTGEVDRYTSVSYTHLTLPTT